MKVNFDFEYSKVPTPRAEAFQQNGSTLVSVLREGTFFLFSSTRKFFSLQNLVTFLSQFFGKKMSKICDTSVLFCVVLSCPCLTQLSSIYF
jgi:hypothetical protein